MIEKLLPFIKDGEINWDDYVLVLFDGVPPERTRSFRNKPGRWPFVTKLSGLMRWKSSDGVRIWDTDSGFAYWIDVVNAYYHESGYNGSADAEDPERCW